MLNIIQKDLIKAFKENEINVLIQQCNCFHTQNAGLAKSIKQEYPEILNVDLATPYGDKNKLGTFSYIAPERKNISQTGYIINLYGQYRYGKGLQTDYDAQRTGFKNIVEFLNNRGPVDTIKIFFDADLVPNSKQILAVLNQFGFKIWYFNYNPTKKILVLIVSQSKAILN